MDTELHGAFSLLKLEAQGVGVYGVVHFRYFSAQSDSTMEISSCTPWLYCRNCGLDVPTSSFITGVRGAASGVKNSCILCVIRDIPTAGHGMCSSGASFEFYLIISF